MRDVHPARNGRTLARGGIAALLLGALALMPSAASAAISFVQQKNATATSAISVAATFTTAVNATAGNVLVVVGGTSAGSLSGVSGAGVSNWFRAESSLTNTHIEIWYGAVDATTSTSTSPITATAASAGDMWMTVTEWSGVSLAVDKSADLAGTTSPASAGSITTTNATDLVIFGAANSTGNTFGTPTPGTWTALTAITSPEAQTTWYQIASATGTFNPTVTETAHSWDAAIVALKGCAATTANASYVSANGQNGSVKIFWSSPNPVLIARNTSNSFGTPTAGTAYAAGAALGTASVVYSGSGNVAPGTFSQAVTNATYYYKIFTNCDLVYSTGLVLSVVPSTTTVWSYATSATTLAAPGIDSNDVVVWGGNDNKIHGANAVDGTLEYPVFTGPTGAIQARPTIIPSDYSITGLNIAYVSSQDGFVYAINTLTGAQVWKSPSLAASGSLQGGTAVWLQSVEAQSICGANTDVVFVGTRTTTVQTNSVYALNGGNTTVTTTSGGKCVAGSIAPGGIMWQFTGATAGTPNLHYMSAAPYLDYDNNSLWVTSRANATTTQPSLWRFNPTNGMLFNGTNACGSGATTSCWNLGDIDTAPAQSSTGQWMYVTTAGTAPLLKAVPLSGATPATYTPTLGSSVASPPYTMGTPSTLGAVSTIAFVNSESKVNNAASTTCVIDMSLASPTAGMTAGNTMVVMFSTNVGSGNKIASIQDGKGTVYAKRTSTIATGAMVEVWSGEIGTGTGAATITVNLVSSLVGLCAAAQYSGVGTVGAYATLAGGTTANPSISKTTVDTNNWLVAGIGIANATAPTPLSGSNLREAPTLSPTALSAALVDKSSAAVASVTVGATHAAANWAAVAVELRSVAAETIFITRTSIPLSLQFNGSTFLLMFTPISCGGVGTGGMVQDAKGWLYGPGTANNVLKFSGLAGGCQTTTLTLPTGGGVMGDLSYDSILNRLYIGSSDGHVYAVNPGF
jgi:hypothetical protein